MGKSCHYSLLGIEFYSRSLVDTWRHFAGVVRALAGNGVSVAINPDHEEYAYRRDRITEKRLGQYAREVLRDADMPLASFVVFEVGGEKPGAARPKP
ncbi:MAG: hypothetical protein OXI71_00800 [Gemmatimonadota bacterium]|nr:hypothetical protein [Gemmatimonadota bacterium]